MRAQTFSSSLQDPLQAIALLAGRVMIAVLFLMSALAKLSAPGAMLGLIQSAGLPLPIVGLVLAIMVELLGGLALIAGLKVRPVAVILAGFSLVTALAFHNKLGDPNQLMHLLKNVAIAGGLLQVAAFGAGRFSLDAVFRARTPQAILSA